jgi:hypothetical protein
VFEAGWRTFPALLTPSAEYSNLFHYSFPYRIQNSFHYQTPPDVSINLS